MDELARTLDHFAAALSVADKVTEEAAASRPDPTFIGGGDRGGATDQEDHP